MRLQGLTRIATLTAIISLGNAFAQAAPPSPKGAIKSITLPERSPLSTIEALFRRNHREFTGRQEQTFAELTPADVLPMEYDLALETFDLNVPRTYRAGDPHGIFVWNGVTAPSPDWYDIIARRKLIFVSPNGLTARSPHIRQGLALDAVHNLSKHYTVDPARVYFSGFSAGAHQSAGTLREYPEIFRGALLMSGGFFYDSTDGEPSAFALGWHGPLPLEQIKRETKVVMVTGADDTVVEAHYARADYKALILDGFRRVTLMERPNWGHNHPDTATFERALETLDAPPKVPPTTAATKDPRPLPSQAAQAERLLRTAKRIADKWESAPPMARNRDDETNLEIAGACLKQLLEDYPTTPAAAPARELLVKIEAALASASTRPAPARKD